MKRTAKRILKLSSLGMLALLATQSFAAGYKLEMQSAAVLADAGDAAVIDDASTNWYNSAGLTYLPQQLVLSVIDVYVPTTFSGSIFAPSPPPPPGSPFIWTGQASSHENHMLPAVHYSLPINQQWAVGLSFAPAFGFSENYGQDAFTRYDLVSVNTKSYDIVPSVAYRPTPQWSFGIGPDINYFWVESVSRARLGSTGTDGVSRYLADDWAVGGHAGIMYSPTEHTRIGLNYRSKMVMQLEGISDLSQDTFPLGPLRSNDFRLRIPLPPTTTLSAYQDITPCWALMGTIAYDQWSVLRNYYAQNYQSLGVVIPAVYVPQSMSNTIDLGIGTHVKLTDALMLRGSIKYEPTPTQNQYRDINFPDGRKLGLQIGAHYQANKSLGLDALYGHVFIKRVPINLTQPVTFVTVNGRSSASVDLFGAQLVWTIC